MRLLESDLDLAFANKIKASPEFAIWVLGHTKFKRYGARVRLLDEIQGRLRKRRFWWKDWWTTIPGQRIGRQIDIFALFESIDTEQRFALYIENKQADRDFEQGQAEAYSHLAKHMMKKETKLNYTDYATILIAPLLYRECHKVECDLFDCFIPYEKIAEYVPEFGY
jgi:hypothetical protein